MTILPDDKIVNFRPLDHALARIGAEPDVLMELYEALSFEAPGAKYDSRVKRGHWDGKIHLIDRRKMTVYAGLQGRLADLCRERGYSLVSPGIARTPNPMTVDQAKEFVNSLDIPDRFERRTYQLEALAQAVSSSRQLFVSPTSSGKSMIIYTAVRWYKQKTLIVVPTVGLVHQMVGDFVDYGCPLVIHKIQDGREIPEGTDIVVSTWQSIYEMPEEWFDQFGLVIGDEAHLFKAQSLIGIMLKLKKCAYRFGFTGTLDGSKVHQLILEGLFGPTYRVTTTAKLMEQGKVAQLKVETVVLEHSLKSKKALEARIAEAINDPGRKQKRGAVAYAQEIAHLYSNAARNRFIVKLATKLPGNVLVLFHHLAHGDVLYDMMVTETDRPVHKIDGGVAGLEREDIRAIIEQSDNAILIASVGTSSTGMNIRRINSMVMTSPWKSQIVVLQSIGRTLRMAEDKTHTTVYDVADSLALKGQAPNAGLKHLAERVRIYEAEGFDYKVHKVDLPD